MIQLFLSKPNHLFSLHWQYSTLFNFWGWIMSNYLFQFILCHFILWLQSPLFELFWFILEYRLFRLYWATNPILISTICPSLKSSLRKTQNKLLEEPTKLFLAELLGQIAQVKLFLSIFEYSKFYKITKNANAFILIAQFDHIAISLGN